jgi:hypothetical protein
VATRTRTLFYYKQSSTNYCFFIFNIIKQRRVQARAVHPLSVLRASCGGKASVAACSRAAALCCAAAAQRRTGEGNFENLLVDVRMEDYASWALLKLCCRLVLKTSLVPAILLS